MKQAYSVKLDLLTTEQANRRNANGNFAQHFRNLALDCNVLSGGLASVDE